MYYPFDILSFIFTFITFFAYGFTIGGLLFPIYLKNKIREHKYLDIFLFIITMGIASYAFLGYVLDIFLSLSLLNFILLLIILLVMLPFRLKISMIQIKTTFSQFFADIKTKKWLEKIKSDPLIVICFVICGIFIYVCAYSFFQLSILNYNIPMTDPNITAWNVIESLNYQHLTWYNYWIGILNWNDRHYPMGFTYILILLNLYNTTNVFVTMKFSVR